MNMLAQEKLEGRTVTLQDLDAVIDIRQFICMVYDAVQHVEWRTASRLPRADETPDAILQSVLTYCYAVGISSSEEIETAATHDAAVRYLCANHRPSWEAIREFRRRNVPFLKTALTHLLRQTAQRASQYYGVASMNRLYPAVSYSTLAEKRLARAVQADSYALDI